LYTTYDKESRATIEGQLPKSLPLGMKRFCKDGGGEGSTMAE